MEIIKSFFKLIIGLILIAFLLGIFATVTCSKKYSGGGYYPSSSLSDEDLDFDLDEDVSISGLENPVNISWRSYNKQTKNIIKNGNSCLFIYFAKNNIYENKVLKDSEIAGILNTKYLAVKITDKKTQSKLNVTKFPSIWIISPQEDGHKINKAISVKKLKSILESSCG